ncbi:MAG: hypothetical protein IKQ56_08375 [Lachnospiraceae bacterium]|nr:hypothetical protein [Lachnospiraceae bacterium]
MLRFLQRKHHGELDQLLASVEGNASNNYKDAAQKAFRELQEKYESLRESGKLNERQTAYYNSMISRLSVELKGFHH